MSLSKVKLLYVSINALFGKPYDVKDYIGDEEGENPQISAKFGLKIETSELNEENEYKFFVFQKMEAKYNPDEEPFFAIEIVGHFETTGEIDASDWVNSKDGAYTLGYCLYPHLRELAKPILQGLGATDIEFPWSPPAALKNITENMHTENKTKRKTRKKTTS